MGETENKENENDFPMKLTNLFFMGQLKNLFQKRFVFFL